MMSPSSKSSLDHFIAILDWKLYTVVGHESAIDRDGHNRECRLIKDPSVRFLATPRFESNPNYLPKAIKCLVEYGGASC